MHVCCRCVDTKEDDGSKYLAAFIVSMALQGFGAVPLYVLGVTYLDDASPHGTASVHIGMVYVLHHLQGDHWWPSLVGGARTVVRPFFVPNGQAYHLSTSILIFLPFRIEHL